MKSFILFAYDKCSEEDTKIRYAMNAMNTFCISHTAFGFFRWNFHLLNIPFNPNTWHSISH